MESYWIFDLCKADKTLYEQYPLYEAYCLFGSVALKTWAAVNGCDFCPSACGIKGMGPDVLLQAFNALKDSSAVGGVLVTDISLHDIASNLKKASTA